MSSSEAYKALYNIPAWVQLRSVRENESVLEPASGLGFYTLFFSEGGLSFPLDPLLVEFFHFFDIVPAQCTPNVFRILGGVIALRDLLSLPIGLNEIRYCYLIKRVSKSHHWYLSARRADRTLVFNLPTSDKDYTHHGVIVEGPVTHAPLPEGEEYDGLPMPTHPGVVGLYICAL